MVPPNMPTVREILHPQKAQTHHLLPELRQYQERTGAIRPRQHGRMPDHRQHLSRHFDHDSSALSKAGSPAADPPLTTLS